MKRSNSENNKKGFKDPHISFNSVGRTTNIPRKRRPGDRRADSAPQQVKDELYRPKIVNYFKIQNVGADQAIDILKAPWIEDLIDA